MPLPGSVEASNSTLDTGTPKTSGPGTADAVVKAAQVEESQAGDSLSAAGAGAIVEPTAQPAVETIEATAAETEEAQTIEETGEEAAAVMIESTDPIVDGTEDQDPTQEDEALIGDEVDAEVVEEGGAEGDYEEEHVEGDAEEKGGGEEEEAEGDEEYEGEEADPYGLDKLVGGISEDEDPQNGENGHEETPLELNGSEEVLEEYEEGTFLPFPHFNDHGT